MCMQWMKVPVIETMTYSSEESQEYNRSKRENMKSCVFHLAPYTDEREGSASVLLRRQPRDETSRNTFYVNR